MKNYLILLVAIAFTSLFLNNCEKDSSITDISPIEQEGDFGEISHPIDDDAFSEYLEVVKKSKIYERLELHEYVFTFECDEYDYVVFNFMGDNSSTNWIFINSKSQNTSFDYITSLKYSEGFEDLEMINFTGTFTLLDYDDTVLRRGKYVNGEMVDYYVNESINTKNDFNDCFEEWFMTQPTILQIGCSTACGACGWSGFVLAPACAACGICAADMFASCHHHL